jgi:hypothetical protein
MRDVTNSDFSFLKEDDESKNFNHDALEQLKIYVEDYKTLNSKIDKLIFDLEEQKESFNELTQETIPQFLSMYGLSEIKLDTGEKIKIKEDLSVTVAEENQTAFFNFLKKRKEEDIIKTNFAFTRMSSDKLGKLITFLNEFDYDYELSKKVHPQTMKKYFKEILGLLVDENDRKKGIEDKRYLRKEDIEDFANVFELKKTTIK